MTTVQSSSNELARLIGASTMSYSEALSQCRLSDDISSCTLTPSRPCHRSLAVGTRRHETFPLRLHRVLSDPDVWPGAISWLPGDESFAVHETDAFVDLVLPVHFPECCAAGGSSVRAKFAMFDRKLERWGFRRITSKGPDGGGYRHPLFKRDEVELCRRMKCRESGVAKTAMESAKNGGSEKTKKNLLSEAKMFEAPMLTAAAAPQFSSLFRSAHNDLTLRKSDNVAHLLRVSESSQTSASATPLLSKPAVAPKISPFQQQTKQRVSVKPALDRLQGTLLSRNLSPV